MPPDLATRVIAGATLHSIAHIYAHALVAEDVFISGAWEREPVLQRDDWTARTGISEASARQTPDWGKLQLSLPPLRDYAKAVYAATDEFLANAAEDAVLREADGPNGKVLVIAEIMLTHVAQHWGEIAALKGVHGRKGLPF